MEKKSKFLWDLNNPNFLKTMDKVQAAINELTEKGLAKYENECLIYDDSNDEIIGAILDKYGIGETN